MAAPSTSAPQPAVAVELFSTSILSNHKIRSRHERYVSVLQVKKIPFVYHDLASDDLAKKRWRRVALDAQIPGLLVHSEWRGTFEEFEEAIEFGELDVFLRIDQERARREADEGIIPQPAPQVASAPRSTSSTKTTKPRKASKHVVKTVPALAQPRAPSMTTLAPALPMAAPREESAETTPRSTGTEEAERFMRSIGLTDLTLTEEELNEVLQAGSSDAKADKSVDGGEQADRGEGKYTNSLGLGTPSSKGGTAVPRTYIPSAEAGVKPLRLAKMGNGESSRSTSATAAPHARYNASQTSSRALAAEAQASAASRAFSSTKLREAVAQGDDLKAAMSSTRLVSNTDKAEQVVGREDIDDLLASLGLNDVKMTDEEAEQFLFAGAIPEGLGSDGTRLGRSDSVVDRARNETAAREVAQRARLKGHGSSASLASSNRSTSSARQSLDGKAIEEDKAADAKDEAAVEELLAEHKADSPTEENQSSTDTILAKTSAAVEPPSASQEEILPDMEKETDKSTSVALEDKVAGLSLEEKTVAGEAKGDVVVKAEEARLPIVEPATEAAERESDADKEEDTTSPPTDITGPTTPAALLPAVEENAKEKPALSDDTPPTEEQATQEDIKPEQTTPKQQAKAFLASTVASPSMQPVDSPLTSGGKVTEPVGPIADGQEATTPTKATSVPTKDLPAPPALPISSPAPAQPTVRVQASSSSPQTSPTHTSSNPLPLEDDPSFAEVASLIQTDDTSDVSDSSRQLVSSPTFSRTSAPAFGAGSLDEAQRDVLQRASPPPSAPAASDANESFARRQTTSPGGDSHSSPTPRSASTSRRRGLDVQRKSIGSNASDRALSPVSSTRSISGMQIPSMPTNGTLSPRSVSQPLESMAAYSPDSQRSVKSPKSPKTKLFSIGRRKSKDKRGSKADEEEEDIPTTTDPTLVDSRADFAVRGGPPMDRSQKTLSVILREADEALAGDDDDLGDDGVVGSFDFDLDDDGIDVER